MAPSKEGHKICVTGSEMIHVVGKKKNNKVLLHKSESIIERLYNFCMCYERSHYLCYVVTVFIRAML